MAYEKKAGESKLFKNKNKVKESDADYQGYYLHEDGVTEEGINAWINTSASGEKYMKLSFWNKTETAAKGVQQARQAMQPKEFSNGQFNNPAKVHADGVQQVRESASTEQFDDIPF